eukprot:3535634-Prorocentrum_lima.AAC.1
MTSSLVGSEMCIRDRSSSTGWRTGCKERHPNPPPLERGGSQPPWGRGWACLLYTSDAADDM